MLVELTGVEFSGEALQSIGAEISVRVAWWIREYYGDRCPEKSEHCPCCQKWAAFDALFAEDSVSLRPGGGS